MRRSLRFLLLAVCGLALGVGAAEPAQARLGGTPDQLANSPLLEGDALFRFEGRVGSRYRFAGARNCRFGSGLFVADVWGRRIVQEILVLPRPVGPLEERRARDVVRRLFETAGIERHEWDGLYAAYDAAVHEAKRAERKIGRDLEVRVRCDAAFQNVMIALSRKP